jgi:expansin (peptidoglycan-binding protein)
MTHTPSTTLSSAQTLLMKLVFPTLWISMFGLGTLALWANVLRSHGDQAPPDAMKWSFLAAWIVGTFFILKLCAGLKRIKVDSRHLYISNYLREITVPLTQIENVTENSWINIHPVTIHFRGDTEFGQRVTFMPKVRYFGGWRSHPVVDELNLLAKNASALTHA